MSENGFQPAIPLNIETGSQSELSAELSQMLTLPQEVAGQNITGKVMATVVIEADGAVSKVEITSSPHPALSETVTDCIYRMRSCRQNMTENALHRLPLFLYYSNENTISPFTMKRLLSTVLLACFVLGAWAQNKTKMTEEEKKRP